MPTPQLTLTIEKKLTSLIDSAEANASAKNSLIEPTLYLQLADLHHFHKNFTQEVAVLERYTRLENADSTELVDIYDRIERISQLQKRQPAPVKVAPAALTLELESTDTYDEPIQVHSKTQIKQRVNNVKKPFNEQCLRVLSVCAAYTGRNDDDEIIQLALVLTEYLPSRDKPGKILDSYWCKRITKKTVPNKTTNQFNLSQTAAELELLERSKVLLLFKQAAFVISHNDADIERKLLITLFPELVQMPWYSSQKDIPWGAIGFDSNSLTHLAVAHQEKPPKNCLERAITINNIVQKTEAYSSQVFLERLYNMQPMRTFEWTPALIKQRNKLTGSSAKKTIWLISGSVLLVSLAIVAFYFYAR